MCATPDSGADMDALKKDLCLFFFASLHLHVWTQGAWQSAGHIPGRGARLLHPGPTCD